MADDVVANTEYWQRGFRLERLLPTIFLRRENGNGKTEVQHTPLAPMAQALQIKVKPNGGSAGAQFEPIRIRTPLPRLQLRTLDPNHSACVN